MIPKLRFKDDNGNDFPAWNTTVRLEEISAFITKGATPTTYGFEWQIKGIYFFRNDCIKNNIFVYGDYSYISEEANEFLKRSEIRGDDIVIAITGDIGKVGLVPRKIKKANINQHLARIRIIKNAIPYFVYSYLCSNEIQQNYKKIKTGLSMAQLSLNQIRKTKIPVVSIMEQRKIAEFLMTIDQVIEIKKKTVIAWEERKKGVMEKLFCQKIRFKTDEKSEFPEWREKQFGEIISEFKEKTEIENEDTLLSCAINGIFLNSELFGHQRGQSNIGYLKIKKGTLVLSTQNLHLGNANVNMRFEHGIISPAYKTYNIVGCSVEYMNQWIKWDTTKRFFYNATTVGASGCRRNVDWNLLYSQKIDVPCLEEQEKIVECLSALDDVVEKQKETLCAWENLKDGLLQQVFI